MIKVEALASFYDRKYKINVRKGQQYEVANSHAQGLMSRGLVKLSAETVEASPEPNPVNTFRDKIIKKGE